MSCAQQVVVFKPDFCNLPAFGNGFTPVIPDLGEHFQARILPPASRQLNEMALSLLALRPDIPLTGKEVAVDVLEAALRQCGEQSGYGEERNLYLRLVTVDEHHFEELGCTELEPDTLFVEVTFGAQGGIPCVDALVQLHAEAPTVATQFLALMESASLHGAWVVTPFELLGIASYAYWYGEDDESFFLEEATDDKADWEEIRANMVTRSDFDEHYPAWMLTSHTLLPVSQLAELVRQLPDRWQTLGNELLALVELVESQQPVLPNNLHMQATNACAAYHAILTRGDADELFVDRILDDHYQYSMEIGGFDIDALIPVADAAALSKCLDQLLPFMQFQRRLDRFLENLSAG